MSEIVCVTCEKVIPSDRRPIYGMASGSMFSFPGNPAADNMLQRSGLSITVTTANGAYISQALCSFDCLQKYVNEKLGPMLVGQILTR